MAPGFQCFAVIEQYCKIDTKRIYCLTWGKPLRDIDNIFKPCIHHGSPPHGSAELCYDLMLFHEHPDYLLCRTCIDDLRTVKYNSNVHSVVHCIWRDKDLSIQRNYVIMKLEDIIILIIALIIAYFIFRILLFIAAFIIFLVVAYMIYLFLKKAL